MQVLTKHVIAYILYLIKQYSLSSSSSYLRHALCSFLSFGYLSVFWSCLVVCCLPRDLDALLHLQCCSAKTFCCWWPTLLLREPCKFTWLKWKFLQNLSFPSSKPLHHAVFLSNFIGYKHCTHADLILKNTPKVITLWLAVPASIVIPATKSYCGSIRSHEH